VGALGVQMAEEGVQRVQIPRVVVEGEAVVSGHGREVLVVEEQGDDGGRLAAQCATVGGAVAWRGVVSAAVAAVGGAVLGAGHASPSVRHRGSR
jgi:hypothetical protein